MPCDHHATILFCFDCSCTCIMYSCCCYEIQFDLIIYIYIYIICVKGNICPDQCHISAEQSTAGA